MPVGLNRGVKKIVTSKVPNLGRCSDMGDLMEGRGGGVSLRLLLTGKQLHARLSGLTAAGAVVPH